LFDRQSADIKVDAILAQLSWCDLINAHDRLASATQPKSASASRLKRREVETENKVGCAKARSKNEPKRKTKPVAPAKPKAKRRPVRRAEKKA
jgi:hypothetical protein